jgi:hypothetical protein
MFERSQIFRSRLPDSLIERFPDPSDFMRLFGARRMVSTGSASRKPRLLPQGAGYFDDILSGAFVAGLGARPVLWK